MLQGYEYYIYDAAILNNQIFTVSTYLIKICKCNMICLNRKEIVDRKI